MSDFPFKKKYIAQLGVNTPQFMTRIFILTIIILFFSLAAPAVENSLALNEKKPSEYAADFLNAARAQNKEDLKSARKVLEDLSPPMPENVAEATAYWINLYNGLVSWQKNVDPEGLHSMWSRQAFFSRPLIKIGGEPWSLNDIEHGILRSNIPKGFFNKRQISRTSAKLRFVVKKMDPRIHGALNCGAVSCPPIAYYHPDKLEEELDMAISNLISQSEFYPGKAELRVSKIFEWYEEDFAHPSLLSWFDRFFENNAYKKAREDGNAIKISYMEYVWK